MTEQQVSSNIDVNSLETTVRETEPNFDSNNIESPAQQRRIEELTFTIAIQDAHTEQRKTSDQISSAHSALPALTETPGPHRLQSKPERPEDIAYMIKM